MKHIKKKCTDPNCNGACNLCELFLCSVCNGAEGSLPTDCPGTKMTLEQEERVYLGKLNFLESQGGWVDLLTSPIHFEVQ